MDKNKIIAIICSILTVISLLLGCYVTYKETGKVDTNKIEQAVNIATNTLKEITVTEETKEIILDTKNATQDGEEIATTEVIENTVPEEEIVDEGAIEQDAKVDQENISYNGDNDGKGQALLGAYQGPTYYSQADSRWASIPYTSVGDYSQTMKSSACGPTSASMVVSSSKGAILPTTMANLFVDNGYRTANNGTAWSAYSFVADYFGFNEYHTTSSLSEVLNYLGKDSNGDNISDYFVIASCGSGLFTTGGHYIVLEDLNGALITVWDPYLYSGKFNTASRRGKVTVSGNNVYCSADNFEKYANYKHFWIYSNDNGNGNNYVPVQPSGYSAGSYEVTASALRVRAGAGTNYRIVTKISNGSKQGVDYTQGNWGHLMNDAGWICLDYCRKINTPSNPQPGGAGSYQVTASCLRVRAGHGTNYRIVTKIYRGSKQGIDYTRGNWGHIMNNAGWICLDYCKRI